MELIMITFQICHFQRENNYQIPIKAVRASITVKLLQTNIEQGGMKKM